MATLNDIAAKMFESVQEGIKRYESRNLYVMPQFQADSTNARYFFQLFSGSLVPRPIAWITTVNEDDTINLAPYSFFGGVNTRPPMIMVSIGRHEGELKHTGKNITRTKECVIHIPSERHMDAVNKSAVKFETNVSEVEVLDLPLIESDIVATPSVLPTPSFDLNVDYTRLLSCRRTTCSFLML